MQELLDHLSQKLSARSFHWKEGDHEVRMDAASLVPIPFAFSLPVPPSSSSFPCSRMLFVDGGEGVLFQSAGLLLFKLSVAGVLFDDVKKEKVDVLQWSCSYSRKGLRTTPELASEIAAAFQKHVAHAGHAASYDAHIPHDAHIPFEQIPGILRKMLEAWHTRAWAREWRAHIAVVDGLLQVKDSPADSADSFVSALYHAIPALLGVAKSSSLVTQEDVCVTAALRSVAQAPSFIPLKRQGQSATLVALLHPKARLAFVIEAQGLDLKVDLEGKAGNALGEALSMLASLCVDVSFLGYPYPLVLADQLARISKEEVQAAKLRIIATLCGNAGMELDAGSAHATLDTMRF